MNRLGLLTTNSLLTPNTGLRHIPQQGSARADKCSRRTDVGCECAQLVGRTLIWRKPTKFACVVSSENIYYISQPIQRNGNRRKKSVQTMKITTVQTSHQKHDALRPRRRRATPEEPTSAQSCEWIVVAIVWPKRARCAVRRVFAAQWPWVREPAGRLAVPH